MECHTGDWQKADFSLVLDDYSAKILSCVGFYTDYVMAYDPLRCWHS